MKTRFRTNRLSKPSRLGYSKLVAVTGCMLGAAASVQAQPDYAPAIWKQAYAGHWYTTGNGHDFCVIHDMEGYYLSTISYIQGGGGPNSVSIHYCVNGLLNGSDEDGHSENRPSDSPAGEITQMVREAYYAFHVGCWNRWMFGTEHEGFASSPAWYSEAMYQASAGLQRHLCDTYGIPKDRNHVIAHGEWKNSAWTSWMSANYPSIDTTCNSHSDPGQYWDWNHFMSLVTGAPTAPANLAATPLSTTQIKLTWTDNSTNETGFKLERAASSSGPWTLTATLGANITSYTNSGLTASTIYYYRVYAYHTTLGNSAYSNIRSATTANSAPVLGAIGGKTVTEGKTLTFTATATDAGLGASTLITDFEAYSSGTASIMFQKASYSGTTHNLFDTNVVDSTAVASTFPAGHASTRVLKSTWAWIAGVANPWVRLTTVATAGFPNPVVDARQILKFDIYCDKAIKVGVGIRETTNAVGTAIGSDGGISGSIEFIGVTNYSSAPAPTRSIPAGSWQTLQFNLPVDPDTSFTGNGVLSTASGLAVLEHLAIVPVAPVSGTYNLYLDNFSVVYSNNLTFSLDAGAPVGASIDPRTGVFAWTPTEAQGPGIYSITVRVSDNGTPQLSDFETISVVVDETNAAPVLASISNKTVTEGSLLTFTATATDSDVPANTLTFSLDAGAPDGASINPDTGAFTWTPAEDQGPGSYNVTVRVTDDNSPPLSNTKSFSITVTESNQPPVLAAIGDQTVTAGATLTITNSATDPDLPANSLAFSLDPGAPIGASINSANGVFAWTPDQSQAGTTNSVTVRVTDNGSPVLSDAKTFHIAVVAEPPSAIVASASVSGQTITIQWNSTVEKTYRVFHSDDASSTNWTAIVPDVTASGATASVNDSMTNNARFYRVQLVN
jgi:Putative Ig domain/N-acetylmuramoyl-L-alanine amidase/Fibronectin type III domain